MKKRFTRLGVVGLALVAALAVSASPAMAKAKKKTVTKTAVFNQCVSVAVPYSQEAGPHPAVVINPNASVPNFKGAIQNGTVTAITSVGVRISHTFVSDNTISLLSPGGRVVTLFNRRDDGGDDFGTGSASCAGTQTLFSDAATTPIATAAPPYAGTFKPDQPLSAVVGGPARGNWVLLVDDTAAVDNGTIHAFSLNFTYSYLAQVKKKKK